MSQFPDDENGDALRHMAEHGVDLSAVHKVEFEHVFGDEASARSFAEAVSAGVLEGATVLETAVRAPEDDEDDEWEVQCRLRLVPTYEAICRVEEHLDEQASALDGYSDGWGLLSKPDGSPAD